MSPENCPEQVSMGKYSKYFGLYPGAKMVSGVQCKINPEAKGRIVGVITKNVIMQKDSYYFPYYRAKRDYLMIERGFEEYIKNPELCPKYQECLERLASRAEKLGRDAKNLPCMGHATGMARNWLAKLLVSNAAEIIRGAEGLNIENFREHHNYIMPKPTEDALPDPKILEAIRKGTRQEKWK